MRKENIWDMGRVSENWKIKQLEGGEWEGKNGKGKIRVERMEK